MAFSNNIKDSCCEITDLESKSGELDAEKERLERRIKLNLKIKSWVEHTETAHQWKTLLKKYEEDNKEMEKRCREIEMEAHLSGNSCLKIKFLLYCDSY